jgi:hypothetical protein
MWPAEQNSAALLRYGSSNDFLIRHFDAFGAGSLVKVDGLDTHRELNGNVALVLRTLPTNEVEVSLMGRTILVHRENLSPLEPGLWVRVAGGDLVARIVSQEGLRWRVELTGEQRALEVHELAPIDKVLVFCRHERPDLNDMIGVVQGWKEGKLRVRFMHRAEVVTLDPMNVRQLAWTAVHATIYNTLLTHNGVGVPDAPGELLAGGADLRRLRTSLPRESKQNVVDVAVSELKAAIFTSPSPIPGDGGGSEQGRVTTGMAQVLSRYHEMVSQGPIALEDADEEELYRQKAAVTVECIANWRVNGQVYKNDVGRAWLCMSRYEFGLRSAHVKPSRIEGAGMGLFARRPILAGEIVTLYPMNLLRDYHEPTQRESKRVMMHALVDASVTTWPGDTHVLLLSAALFGDPPETIPEHITLKTLGMSKGEHRAYITKYLINVLRLGHIPDDGLRAHLGVRPLTEETLVGVSSDLMREVIGAPASLTDQLLSHMHCEAWKKSIQSDSDVHREYMISACPLRDCRVTASTWRDYLPLGWLAHMANSSRDGIPAQNCTLVRGLFGGLLIALVSIHSISEGEELIVNYGEKWWESHA